MDFKLFSTISQVSIYHNKSCKQQLPKHKRVSRHSLKQIITATEDSIHYKSTSGPLIEIPFKQTQEKPKRNKPSKKKRLILHKLKRNEIKKKGPKPIRKEFKHLIRNKR